LFVGTQTTAFKQKSPLSFGEKAKEQEKSPLSFGEKAKEQEKSPLSFGEGVRG
jgi:hypothetical protein